MVTTRVFVDYVYRQNYQKEREAREAAERQRREMEAQLQAYKIEAEKAKEGESAVTAAQ